MQFTLPEQSDWCANMPIRLVWLRTLQFYQWTCPGPIFRQGHWAHAKNLVSGDETGWFTAVLSWIANWVVVHRGYRSCMHHPPYSGWKIFLTSSRNHSLVSPPISSPGSPTNLTFTFFFRSFCFCMSWYGRWNSCMGPHVCYYTEYRSNFAIFITKLCMIGLFWGENRGKWKGQQLPGIEPRTPGLCSQAWCLLMKRIFQPSLSRVLIDSTYIVSPGCVTEPF